MVGSASATENRRQDGEVQTYRSAITLDSASVITLAQSDTWSKPQSFCQSNRTHARARIVIGSNRAGMPSHSGPWTVAELVSGARRSIGYGNSDLLEHVSLSNALYAIRMPLLMATKIQRAYRALSMLQDSYLA